MIKYVHIYIYIQNLYISKINIDKQCNSWVFEQNLLSTELQLLALASAAGCEVAKGTPGLARRDAQIQGDPRKSQGIPKSPWGNHGKTTGNHRKTTGKW